MDIPHGRVLNARFFRAGVENGRSPGARGWRTPVLRMAGVGERPFCGAWVENGRSLRAGGWRTLVLQTAGVLDIQGGVENLRSPGPGGWKAAALHRPRWRTPVLHGAGSGERPFSMAWVGNARSPRGRAWENARSPEGRFQRTPVLHGRGGRRAGFRERPFSTAGVGERPLSRGPVSENTRSPRLGLRTWGLGLEKEYTQHIITTTTYNYHI